MTPPSSPPPFSNFHAWFDASDSQSTRESLESILSNINDGFFTLDRDWRYTYVNRRILRRAGLQAEELLGQSIWDRFPDVVGSLLDSEFRRTMANQTAAQFEFFYSRWDRWFEIRVYPSSKGLAVFTTDITERKQAEAAFRSSEERLKLASQAARIGTFEWNIQTNQVVWSAEQESLYGMLPGGFAGHYEHWRQAVHSDDRDRLEQEVLQAITTGTDMETEFRIVWPDDTVHWLSAKARVFCDSNAKPLRLIGINQDISDRKHMEAEHQQTEAALRESEAKYRRIVETASEGIWLVDAEMRTTYVNQAMAEMLGYQPEEMLGRSSFEFIFASDRAAAEQRREQRQQGVVEQLDFVLKHRDGFPVWIRSNSRPIFDEQGQRIGTLAMVSNITERKQAEKALERYQLLSENSRDIVLYVSQKGQILEANQAAVQAYGCDRATLLTLNIADLRSLHTLPTLENHLNQASRAGILFETVHQRQDGSEFPVEVSAQSAVIGTESVVLSVIRDITERKQAELEREQLLTREQAARKAAETAEQRARFLAEIGTTLTSSLDYEYTLKSVAQAVVPTLADWCAVDILEDKGTLARLATAHVDPAKVQWGLELHRRYPPNLKAAQGIAQILRTGQAECYPSISDEQIVAAARDAEHLRLLREVGFSSVMMVPLNARGRTLGVISFIAAESGRSYGPDDLSLAEELARRAAIALDNARLYQEAQEARQIAERAADRTSRLQAVTAALSESLTPLQVAEVIVEQSIAALEADAALMALLSEDGTMLEIVRAVGYEVVLNASYQRFSINASFPLAEAVRTGKPAWSEPIAERLARYPHLAEAYQRLPFESWISLPLIVEGKAVGGLSLSFAAFKDLSQDDRDFMLALTRQCAQAIVRAQLYEAEQQARAEAEQANRIKDEFLAVLSHELRSPLNPILGWTKILRSGKLQPEKAERALETIERNAKLQAQLIEDLLDISRMLQGKLSLNIAPVDLTAVIQGAIETVQLAASAKSIQIQTILPPTDSLVLGDANRLQQVFWNLLSNAVKFTPNNGQVTVELQQLSHQIQIQVTDTGKGISPDFLPHVFEYFRQADSSTTRNFGGLGLGLAIARQIVELHGGTIKADSLGEGLGATFTVCLPIATSVLDQPTDTESLPQTPNLTGLQILVVDDEADMRDLIEFILRQHGVQVRVASSATEAEAKLSELVPDLLLCDIGMPEMDGYMLMRRIRQKLPEQGGKIPAIALTAYAAEYDQQQAFNAGFQRHVAKPVEPEVLVRAIADLLKKT